MNGLQEVYIRFGDIPKDKQSKVYFGDAIIRNEGGVSVWRTICADGIYFPVMPKDVNENGIMDYFRLLFSDKPIYLVTGTEIRIEGADREPLLGDDITIIKKLDYSWLKTNIRESEVEK